MSSISSVFLENFTRKLTEEPLVFRKIKPNANGIRFISSYEDIPISIRVNNEDFPETPLYTVSAEFSTEKDQKVLKDLFFAENVYQLPKAWQIPRNQPKPDTSFHPK